MSRRSRLPKIRRRFHRAFLKWLTANQSRFVTPPFRIIKRTDRQMRLTIPGLHPALSFDLSDWDLGLIVEWQGIYWDSIIYFEAYPVAIDGGYHCSLCDAEHQKLYASKETLWIEHAFESFLEWVNTELVTARWLAICGGPECGVTWVEFVEQPNQDAVATVPVWLHEDND